jgi:hypothetical protein
MNRMSVLPIEALVNETSLEVPVEIEWVNINSEKNTLKDTIYLFRFSPAGAWEVDRVRFLKDSQIL